jgi:hypothetical protein
MTATTNQNSQIVAQFDPMTVRSGDYAAQRLLDFRLVSGERLEIISALEGTSPSEIEQDFRIAVNRRDEPEGATLTEMSEKYGL